MRFVKEHVVLRARAVTTGRVYPRRIIIIIIPRFWSRHGKFRFRFPSSAVGRGNVPPPPPSFESAGTGSVACAFRGFHSSRDYRVVNDTASPVRVRFISSYDCSVDFFQHFRSSSPRTIIILRNRFRISARVFHGNRLGRPFCVAPAVSRVASWLQGSCGRRGSRD